MHTPLLGMKASLFALALCLAHGRSAETFPKSLQGTPLVASASAASAAATGYPYGDPFKGPCQPKELNMSVTGVAGLYCAPRCSVQ